MPDIVGATKELRLSTAALFRFEVGGLPVCCVNLAFSVAMAAAASGNMALMVDESSPDCRLPIEMAEFRDIEFLAESTFSLFIASLRRFDMGSGSKGRQTSDNIRSGGTRDSIPLSKLDGDRTPDMG